MARLKGKGSMTQVNLLAKTYDNATTKDGKTQFIDVQIDHRDPRGSYQLPGQHHLVSQRTAGPDGETRYNNGAAYSKGQFDKIVETAGPNHEPIFDKDNNKIGAIYAVKADLMPSSKGNGLVLNSETLAQSDFKIDSKTMAGQFAAAAAAKAAKDALDAQQGAAAEVSEAEVEAQVEAEEPAMG